MTTTVIAYFPSPPQGVWHLGPVPIRAYALFIIVGIVAALLIGDRRWEARGGERGVIYDIALWAVPFGLIGGRLYHLATDWRTYFGEGGAGPAAALRIWDGGLGIWGAVALGGVGAWIACRRRGIPLPAFGDAIAPGIVLAQAIGRLGNYFNQELFGRETTMPWGLEIFYRRDPAGFVDVHSLDGVSTGQLAMVVQPTFLYELLWNLLVFAVLIYLDRRFTIGHGRLFALYVAGYCIGRFWIELLRDDSATHIAGIRINSFTSTFVFIGAVVYLILAPKGREDPATLSGSAAELLEPDSIEEVETVSSSSAAAVAAAVDEPVDSEDAAETVEANADVEAEVEAEEPEAEAGPVTETARRAAEAGAVAEGARRAAEEAEAEVVKRAADAEGARRAAEEAEAEVAKRTADAEGARRAAEEAEAEVAKRTAEARSLGEVVKRAAVAGPVAEAARRAAEEAEAEVVKRAAEAEAVAEAARRAAEEAEAERAKRAADAEGARRAAEGAEG
ncbi:MAG: hypothetical protein QOG75_1666, partial [Mycobacterium sp.]|nr:hypothetical protein [Mycobacterium sp.]